MFLIVALGNPGEEYEHTRHNVAWLTVRDMMTRISFPKPHSSREYAGDVAEGILYGTETRILFPTTFMNNAGVAVKKTLGSMPLSTLIVVHDDVDLPFGVVRIGVARGAGGHNGVKSIIDKVASNDFLRIRIGVAKKNILGIVRRPTGDRLADFVLAEFGKREMSAIPEIGKQVERAIELVYTKGVEGAMTEVNST